MGYEGLHWIQLAPNRDRWRTLVKTVMNFWNNKGGEFLGKLKYYQLLKKDFAA
jgi:hypothetical protein